MAALSKAPDIFRQPTGQGMPICSQEGILSRLIVQPSLSTVAAALAANFPSAKFTGYAQLSKELEEWNEVARFNSNSFDTFLFYLMKSS